jgi:hypothetical protein
MEAAALLNIANIYGWWFEKESNIMNQPAIPFYGRYIDDCLAIVYATSEEEAVTIVSKLVQFDGCRIEWNASDKYQVFLDMMIFFDQNNEIQHKPYRKNRSHQERIPWISHHPLDVKRGTFIGEMSRLATISSRHSDYCEAVKGLATLYIARGYPDTLVLTWLRNNIKERWENRLNDNKPAREQVLVLKSEFNTTWNYFNATELGNTIMHFWRDWLQHAEKSEFSLRYPPYSQDLADLGDCDRSLMIPVTVDGESFDLPDIRKLGIFNRKLIVSRKRTLNLFDLTNLWKRLVLTKMDEDILPDNHGQVVEPLPTEQAESDSSDSSDDSDLDPFVQLLRNQGATF